MTATSLLSSVSATTHMPTGLTAEEIAGVTLARVDEVEALVVQQGSNVQSLLSEVKEFVAKHDGDVKRLCSKLDKEVKGELRASMTVLQALRADVEQTVQREMKELRERCNEQQKVIDAQQEMMDR